MNEAKITVTDQMKPWRCGKCGRYHHKAFPDDGCDECSGAAISKRLGLDREPAMTQTPAISTLASSTGSAHVVSQEVLKIEKEVREQGGVPEQKLRDKCNWEHMSRTAVIKCWGDPRTWASAPNDRS